MRSRSSSIRTQSSGRSTIVDPVSDIWKEIRPKRPKSQPTNRVLWHRAGYRISSITPVRSGELTETDFIIALMGPTGAGKSTFIQIATGRGSRNSGVGHGLESRTSEVKAFRISFTDNVNVVLVDTPGFGDTYPSDLEVLEVIVNWLRDASQYELCGILYLHRVSDNRMLDTPLKNHSIFQKLCGEDCFRKVILATTMRPEKGSADEQLCIMREEELKRDYWASMISRESTLLRFKNTQKSAWSIIDHLITTESRKQWILIQEELMNETKELIGIKDGQQLHGLTGKLVERQVDLLRGMTEKLRRTDNPAILQTILSDLSELRKERKEAMRNMPQPDPSILAAPRQAPNPIHRQDPVEPGNAGNGKRRSIAGMDSKGGSDNDSKWNDSSIGEKDYDGRKENGDDIRKESHDDGSGSKEDYVHVGDDNLALQELPGDTRATVWRLIGKILSNKSAYQRLLDSTGPKAQMILNILQKLSDSQDVPKKLRRDVLYATMRLCEVSGVYPQCLELREISYDNVPVASGGFGDIWKGYHRAHPICLKVARVYVNTDIEQLIKGYARETIVWSQLSHPNVLPFYGIYYLDKPLGRLGLVSPWMQSGNVIQYLKSNPEAPRLPLIHGILAGLVYLHEQWIVHGDLKGANILISPDGSACLADFGLSCVADPDILRWTSLKSLTKTGGTVRWEAPELMDEVEDEPLPRPTFLSDIYSIASVMYEILTGRIPFHNIRNDGVVMSWVLNQKRPSKPSSGEPLELSDQIWAVMQKCWAHIPDQRPTARQVAELLREIPQLELTTNRATRQSLEKKSKNHVENEVPPTSSFRDAMRGHSSFCGEEVDLLREYENLI